MLRFKQTLAALTVIFVLIVAPVGVITAGAQTQTGGGNSGAAQNEGGGSSGGTQTGGGNSGGLINPLGNTKTLDGLLGKVLDAIIAIGVVVITIMLVYCGFLFVVAQGNEEKIRTARSALLWTIIGALILLGAKVIAEVISNTVKAL